MQTAGLQANFDPLKPGAVAGIKKNATKSKTKIHMKTGGKALIASTLICWTLALTKLLRSSVILHHVTINHFTFFYISATLRPDSLSRQTWCELSKVSHSTCCLPCCWMVLVDPSPFSVRGGCLCLTWNLCTCPFFHSFLYSIFKRKKHTQKGNFRNAVTVVACQWRGFSYTFTFCFVCDLIPFFFPFVLI